MGIRTLKRTIMTGVAGAALLAVAAAGTVAWAANEDSDLYIEPDLKDLQRPPGAAETPSDLFNLLDDNNDGVIDSGEWRSQKMFVFYARDANQNYMLTREEIPGIADSVFKAADTDHDGLMSGFEFNQAEFTQFQAVDGDVNQTVNYDEFLAFAERIEKGVGVQNTSAPTTPSSGR
jgi:Ca2+-binding EF-hand superfamily protein